MMSNNCLHLLISLVSFKVTQINLQVTSMDEHESEI